MTLSRRSSRCFRLFFPLPSILVSPSLARAALLSAAQLSALVRLSAAHMMMQLAHGSLALQLVRGSLALGRKHAKESHTMADALRVDRELEAAEVVAVEVPRQAVAGHREFESLAPGRIRAN